MAGIAVIALEKSHEVASFDCGQPLYNFKPLISDPNILVMPIASMPKFLDANRI